MSKLQNVWVLADQEELGKEICSGADELGEKVSIVYAGEKDREMEGDTAYYLGEITETRRWTGYVPAIVRLVKEKKPNLILIGATKNGRLIAGALAAACETSVLTDITDIMIEHGVTVKRMVYGGAAYRTEQAEGETLIVCVGAGKFAQKELGRKAKVQTVEYVNPGGSIQCRAVKKKKVLNVNIASAKRVISVGRGIGAQENLAMIEALARKLDAAVGCSRPIAEEMRWLPREVYVGVSGVMIKPDLYIAVGISGQVQHLVGCNQAGILIGINKDKNAPIFRYVDYGIVGDCTKIIPRLLDKAE